MDDPLEPLSAVVEFEIFRGPFAAVLAARAADRGLTVLMFKILMLQALYSVSKEAAEFQI